MGITDHSVKGLDEYCLKEMNGEASPWTNALALLKHVNSAGQVEITPRPCHNKDGSINVKAKQAFCCYRDGTKSGSNSLWSRKPIAGWPNDPRSTHFTSELKKMYMQTSSKHDFGPELKVWKDGKDNACKGNNDACGSKLATYQRFVQGFYSWLCNHDVNTMISRSTRGLLLFHSTGSGKSNSAINAMMGMWGKTDPSDPQYKLIVLASNADTASVGLDTYFKDAANSCPHPLMEHARTLYCGDQTKLLMCAKVILLLSLPIAWNSNPNRTLDPITYYEESEDFLLQALSKQGDSTTQNEDRDELDKLLKRADALGKLQNLQTLWGQMLRKIHKNTTLRNHFMKSGDEYDTQSREFLKKLRESFEGQGDKSFDMKKREDVEELRRMLVTLGESFNEQQQRMTTANLSPYEIDTIVLNTLASAKKYGKIANRELKQFQSAGVDSVDKLHNLRRTWRELSLEEQKEIVSKWFNEGKVDEKQTAFADYFFKLQYIESSTLHISFNDLYSWISPSGFTTKTKDEQSVPDQASLREYWTRNLPLDKNMLFLIIDEAHTLVQKSNDVNDGLVWNRLYSELNSRDDNPEYRCDALKNAGMVESDTQKFGNNGMTLLLMTATPGDNPCEIVRLLSLLHSHRTMLSDIAIEEPVTDVPLYKISHEVFLEDSATSGEIVYVSDRETPGTKVKKQMQRYENVLPAIEQFEKADNPKAAQLAADTFVNRLVKDLKPADGAPETPMYKFYKKEGPPVKKLKKYLNSTQVTNAANNVLLFKSQQSSSIASLQLSMPLLSLVNVLSMDTIFALLNGDNPNPQTLQAVVRHFVDEELLDSTQMADETVAQYARTLQDSNELKEFLKALDHFQERPGKYRKLSKNVEKGALDHFFISDQTTLKYNEKNESQIQYFVHTDTRTTLKQEGQLFGAFCQGLVSYIDATTDRTKFVKYRNNHEISHFRKTADPFHVQVQINVVAPEKFPLVLFKKFQNYLDDLILACNRGETKFTRRKDTKKANMYKTRGIAIQDIKNEYERLAYINPLKSDGDNEEEFVVPETAKKIFAPKRRKLKDRVHKVLTEDFDDYNTNDLPIIGRAHMRGLDKITPNDLRAYSTKVHALWMFLVGKPILGEKNGVSAGLSKLPNDFALPFEGARHFVHFPYVLEKSDHEFLVYLIDNTVRAGENEPPLKCWLPELNYDHPQALPNNCRWVSLMLTVKDDERVPPTAARDKIESVDFFSRMSLAAFNHGNASPWKLDPVNCTNVNLNKLQDWAALVTDGQKHKAFNICYGQFTHFVSHPRKLSAAQQAKGRLTRYCSHGAAPLNKWNAALVVYFNVSKYMFLPPESYESEKKLRHVPPSDERVFQLKRQIQKLEAMRRQDSTEYATYYDVLQPNAQQKMHAIMQKTAIDCPIFSHLFSDMPQGHCFDYVPTRTKNSTLARHVVSKFEV